MIKTYRFVKGYLTVKAKGNHIEKFLNLSLVNRIYLWDIKRLDEKNVLFCVSNQGFGMMAEYAEKTGTELKTVSRDGLPVLWKTTKKRTAFLISAVTVLLTILIASSFIWTVDIAEQNFIANERIYKKLKEYGLGVGSFRKTVDYTAISNRLINDFDEILWANVELHGTKLKVTLIPRTKAPTIIPKEIPVNIVAKKDGFIKEITAENGDAMVKVGDTVLKDQILISGLIPSPTVGSRYLHAIGSVRAVTWTEKTLEKKLYHYDKIKTGNQIVQREIILPFVKIPLYFQETIDFYNYDSIIEERNFFFLTYRKKTYEEYNLQKNSIPLEQAVSEAILELSEQLNQEGINHIISQKTDYRQTDEETITVSILAECEEELGIQKEIIKPEIAQ